MMQRNAAVYVRVSTTDQGERYSPVSQKKANIEKAVRDGYVVREEHVFEDHLSGKSTARPQFERMRQLAKTGAFSAVYIYSVDRFARKTADALMLAAELKRSGVKLDFIEMPYEDTPTGRFTFTQMAAVAELIGEKIIEDSKRGRKQKLEEGKPTSTCPKFGYKYIDKRQPDGGRFVIDEEKAPIVREMFRWSQAGMTLYGIAKKLNEEGILSAGSSRYPPGLWCRKTILQVLRSPVYKGQHICNGIVIPCDAIIDAATWQTVQDTIVRNRVKHQGRPSSKYLLRSLLWCGKPGCGKRCTTARGHLKGETAVYYRCGNIDHRTNRRICDARGVMAHLIETAAWKAIWNLLKNPELLMRLGKQWHEANAKPDNLGTRLEKELAKLRAHDQRLVDMAEAGVITVADSAAKLKPIRQRIGEIAEELRAAGKVIEMPTLAAAKATLREITEGAEPETYEERRLVLEGLIDLRMKYLDGDLEIEGKVPVAAAVESTGSGKKNCYRRVDANHSSSIAVPFVIRQKVA